MRSSLAVPAPDLEPWGPAATHMPRPSLFPPPSLTPHQPPHPPIHAPPRCSIVWLRRCRRPRSRSQGRPARWVQPRVRWMRRFRRVCRSTSPRRFNWPGSGRSTLRRQHFRSSSRSPCCSRRRRSGFPMPTRGAITSGTTARSRTFSLAGCSRTRGNRPLSAAGPLWSSGLPTPFTARSRPAA